MDYKELIETLRDESNCDVLDYIEDAAAAIETLLAEREALMGQIRGHCIHCANARKCYYTDDKTMCDCARNNLRHWQWRGPTLPDRQKTENR